MLRFLHGSDKETDPDSETNSASSDEAQSGVLSDEASVVSEPGRTALSRQEESVTGQTDGQVTILKQKIEGLERRIGYLERIVKVSQILNSTLHLAPLLQIITQSAMELTNTEACSIMLIDKHTGELRFAEATGENTDDLKKVSVPLDNSIGGWVIRQNKPLLIRDAKSDPRWHGDVDDTITFDTRSILGVPLKVRDRTIGVLEIVNKKDD